MISSVDDALYFKEELLQWCTHHPDDDFITRFDTNNTFLACCNILNSQSVYAGSFPLRALLDTIHNEQINIDNWKNNDMEYSSLINVNGKDYLITKLTLT